MDYRKQLHTIFQSEVILNSDEGSTKDRQYFKSLEKVHKSIPNKIYRFRKLDKNQFTAFISDKLFVGKPGQFNDPYDNLPYYNEEVLVKKLYAHYDAINPYNAWQHIKDKNCLPSFYDKLPSDEKVFLLNKYQNKSEEQIKEDLQKFELIRRKLDELRKTIPNLLSQYKDWHNVVCFTEEIENMLMWTHYADSHKGFVLEYDTENLDQILPVIYNSKRLDSTDFIYSLFWAENTSSIYDLDKYGHFKIMLYKDRCWEYEKEWRMFIMNKKPDSIVLNIQPTSIIYGSLMPLEDIEALSHIATSKGIKEYKANVELTTQQYKVKITPYS